ncbi:hypothetical protein B9Z55_027404 [Caenorhabditis nigoni]|uniref:Uncharacterized protein n=1 Tax=Caenorhabditis nigoni TaxID=1611254 RepID=A0A2G5SFW7_9PELO|nr:hypothetical protein B9Z55_027404 [Caenorhabditis nigoni]
MNSVLHLSCLYVSHYFGISSNSKGVFIDRPCFSNARLPAVRTNQLEEILLRGALMSSRHRDFWNRDF